MQITYISPLQITIPQCIIYHVISEKDHFCTNHTHKSTKIIVCQIISLYSITWFNETKVPLKMPLKVQYYKNIFLVYNIISNSDEYYIVRHKIETHDTKLYHKILIYMISIITILPLHLSALAQSWRKYCLPMPPRAAEITPSHTDGPSQTDPENNTT